jgi:hypothetical protein
MLIGYVSDERYVALCDVVLEFAADGQPVTVVRSTPSGAVYADLPPGPYQVTMQKPGYGAKRVTITATPEHPHHFRLLADRLLGYMWPKWVRSGERSEFRVHSTSPYRLSLWRYGWEKTCIRLLGWFDEHGPRAVMQLTPDGDYTQTGVRWNTQGYGSLHHTQYVPGPERSGLYYLHAENEAGEFFAFPWVVAPATPTAPIAVLASSNTWNAYNNFGGRSNYINATRLPPTPIVNARLDLKRYAGAGFSEWGAPNDAFAPLSFDRPEIGNTVPKNAHILDPVAGRLASSLAPAEWRLLGWLEREGFAHDVYADAQLHDGTLDLDAYSVLIISVHPEYWSRRMFERVKQWVDQRGGRLMYLGGNGLNCEVEFPDGATMRCKSQLLSENGSLGMRDPANPEVYYESRFHATVAPEAGLLGVVTTETGIMTAAPYRVVNADHWVFAGTGLQNGDRFGLTSQHERCAGGASGHETDKMSPSSPEGTVLLAKGLNPDDGGAEITYYTTSSGGAVFSVGSIIWPLALLVDKPVAQITANVLRRFLR